MVYLKQRLYSHRHHVSRSSASKRVECVSTPPLRMVRDVSESFAPNIPSLTSVTPAPIVAVLDAMSRRLPSVMLTVPAWTLVVPNTPTLTVLLFCTLMVPPPSSRRSVPTGKERSTCVVSVAPVMCTTGVCTAVLVSNKSVELLSMYTSSNAALSYADVCKRARDLNVSIWNVASADFQGVYNGRSMLLLLMMTLPDG